MNFELKNIIGNFNIESYSVITKLSDYHITKLDRGHINDTYIIEIEGLDKKYILQRINHEIFKNVPGLIKNILSVTRHISAKIDSTLTDNILTEKLELIQTKDDNYYYYKDSKGNYWRL